MPLPESTLVEVKPAGGFTAIRPRGIPVFVGCSSKGSLTAPASFGRRRQATMAAANGAGPMSRESCYVASQTNSECLTMRVRATSRAASMPDDVTVARDGSSDWLTTLSGTPTDGADVVVKLGPSIGLTGAGPIAYQVSTNGGDSYGPSIDLGTDTTIDVLGVTWTLGTGKTVTEGDTAAWFQRAASGSVSPVTVTRVSTSTATYDVTGTPEDAYRVRLEWLRGGTLGTGNAATYRIALDYDPVNKTGKWSDETHLHDALTILPLDGTEPSGLTITLADDGVGTIDAGDFVEFRTTAPEPQWSDIAAAMAIVRASGLLWSFFAICAPLSAADAASATTLVEGWAAGTRRTWVVCETRDRESTEGVAAWATRVRQDFVGWASTRVFPAAGHAPMADPITGRRDRRSALVDYVSRLVSVPKISTDAGQVTLGPLPASRALYASDAVGGQQLEYDADADPQLFDAHGDGQGFLVLRTFEDDQFPGTYPAGAICMPPAGDLGLVQLRRVLDAFEDALQSQARLELLSNVRRYTTPQVAETGGKYKAGDVREEDALAIERRLRGAASKAVIKTGDASGIESLALERTPIDLGGGKKGLRYAAQLVGLATIYGMTGTAGLVDPEA